MRCALRLRTTHQRAARRFNARQQWDVTYSLRSTIRLWAYELAIQFGSVLGIAKPIKLAGFSQDTRNTG